MGTVTAIGFTGTRHGMTAAQLAAVIRAIEGEVGRGAKELHEGDCIGADKQVTLEVFRLELCRRARAFGPAHVVHDPLGYLARNRVIVDVSQVLIAAPGECRERLRSGTWATVRYARTLGRRIVLITPDGRKRLEGGVSG